MLSDPWLPDLYLQAPDDFIACGHQSKTEPRPVYEEPSRSDLEWVLCMQDWARQVPK